MRITTDDMISELKVRLDKEKSLKKKVQLKQLIDLIKEI